MSRKKIEAGEAYVGLGIRSKLKQGLAKATARLRSFGAGATRIGGLVAGIGAGIGAAFIPAISAASDFQERFSKFNTVFGEQSAAVKAWGDEFASQVGRSKSEIVNFLGSTQDLLVPLGLDPKAATETTKQITRLATDLASFNNMADADALRDIQAALTGSGEVMKKYGVIVSAAATKQELLNDNIDPKEATEAQKAMARLAIIMRGTTAAQGDAIKTAGSFANRMKALKASFSDFLVEAGKPLLSVLANVAGYLTDAIKVVSGFIQRNQTLVLVAAGVATGLIAAGVAIATAGAAASVAAGLFTALSTIIAAVASPAGIVVAALVGMVAQFTILVGLPVAAFFAVWINSSKEATDLLKSIGTELGKLLSIAKDTFGGIFAAIKKGKWSLAGKIALAGLKAAIYTGLESIQDNWHTWLEMLGTSLKKAFDAIVKYTKKALDFIEARMLSTIKAAQKIGSGDFAGASLQVLSGLASEFEGVLSFDNMFGDIKANAEAARKELASLIEQAKNADKGWDVINDFSAFVANAGDMAGKVSSKFADMYGAEKEKKEPKKDQLPKPMFGDAIGRLRDSMQHATKASLNARSFARGGPGARSLDKKLLDQANKQRELLELINEGIRNLPIPGTNFG